MVFYSRKAPEAVLKRTLVFTTLMATSLAAACATLTNSTPSGSEEQNSRPQVMLVPSYHLNNNNRDLINLPIEDVLVPQRQAEIERLVDNLARWQPTKIVLEWDAADQEGLDRRYQQYLSGGLAITANERDQIGLRLAAKLGHKRVYAADWNESFPGDRSDYDFMAWAKENGEDERLQAFVEQGQARLDRQAEFMRSQSIVDWYYDLADPALRAREHADYFTIASFGDTDRNPGAAWVGGWYGRNLRIFNNIQDITQPTDRVLVLYGLGHAYLLERFWIESATAQMVDPRRIIRR